MRQLTFPGFMKRYVASLSGRNTKAIYPLVQEAIMSNIRLKEPLFLYALSSGKMRSLMSASRGTPLYDEYQDLSQRYGYSELITALAEESPKVPNGYHKVWRSYKSEAGSHDRDNRVKELMRARVVAVRTEKHISTYRICKDLQLNNSNVNAWLKKGSANKVGLDTARAVLRYVEEK